jgi:predicted acylesterase/phospholipase RssA
MNICSDSVSFSFVVARRMESTNEVAIKDYTPVGEQNHDRATIVEAALATSAASSFFPPVKIGNREYVDGALGTNNPVEILWKEAQDIWAPDDGQIKPKLKAIISVGTGHPGLKKIEKSVWGFFKNTLTDMVTQTDQTARNFQFTNRDLIQPQHQRQYFR